MTTTPRARCRPRIALAQAFVGGLNVGIGALSLATSGYGLVSLALGVLFTYFAWREVS